MSNTGRDGSSSHEPCDGTLTLEIDVTSRIEEPRGRWRRPPQIVGRGPHSTPSLHSGSERSAEILLSSAAPISNSLLGAATGLRTLAPAPLTWSTYPNVTHHLSYAWVNSQGPSTSAEIGTSLVSDRSSVFHLEAPVPTFDPRLFPAHHKAGQVYHWQMSLEEAPEISQYKLTIVAKACAKFEIGATFYHTLDIVLGVWTIDNPENDDTKYVWMLRIWRSECLRLLSGKLVEDRSSCTISATERYRPKRFETFENVVTTALQQSRYFPRDIPERRSWQSNPMDEEETIVIRNALEQARPRFEGSSTT